MEFWQTLHYRPWERCVSMSFCMSAVCQREKPLRAILTVAAADIAAKNMTDDCESESSATYVRYDHVAQMIISEEYWMIYSINSDYS